MKKTACFLVGLLLLAHPAMPCSCGHLRPVAEAFEQSSLVVLARVAHLDDRYSWWHRIKARLGLFPDGSNPAEYYDFFGYRVTLTVERAWKGASDSATVTILTGRGGGDCGYLFMMGERYLVYASPTSVGLPSTTICQRTRAVSEAQLDIQALDSSASMKDAG